jgi:hypothetical protein
MFSSVSHSPRGWSSFLELFPSQFVVNTTGMHIMLFILLCRQIGTNCSICVYRAKPSASNTIASIGLVMGYGFGKTQILILLLKL